ncbi:MAG TPA: zinc-ribbon domain-containing protein [Nitrososphaerales archaeon]|nr:zinc-ribbon domain-containing protein [Nitrososphaerales archaeon]
MSSTGYLKREALLGKPVVSKNAEIVGTVSDLAASTDGRMAIQVQRKNPTSSGDTDLFIGAEEILAVGDVILLKSAYSSVSSPVAPVPAPPAPAPTTVSPPPPPGGIPQSRTCQKCGYVNAPNAKFCIRCGASLLQ